MTTPIEIRQATPADAEDVRRCARDAYVQYVAAIGREPAPMVADFPRLIAAGRVHVAVRDGADVLGFIVFYPDGDALLLENVAVRPDATGMGVGKRLVAFCEDAARRAGARAVTLYTNEKMTANLSIYPHLGYRETGRRHEDGFDRVYFEKPL